MLQVGRRGDRWDHVAAIATLKKETENFDSASLERVCCRRRRNSKFKMAGIELAEDRGVKRKRQAIALSSSARACCAALRPTMPPRAAHLDPRDAYCSRNPPPPHHPHHSMRRRSSRERL